ncbi:MAG: nucleotidyltransferase domain-containing protein [Cyanobacteria bacterium J06554_6]
MLIDLSDLVKDRLSTSQQQIDDFCQHWKIARLSLFGSVLREDFGPDSDIDVLYLFLPNHGWTAFDWLDMRAELARLFGRKIDLVSQLDSAKFAFEF